MASVQLGGRTVLTVQQRLDMVHDLESGVPVHELAMKYRVHPNSVRRIKRHSSQLHHHAEERPQIKKMRKPTMEALDARVYSWLLERRAVGDPISGPLLREVAMRMNEEMGGPAEFKSSSGWLHSFKTRHGIKLPVRSKRSGGNREVVDGGMKKYEEEAEEVKDAEEAEEVGELQRRVADLEEAGEVDELQRSDADLEEAEEVKDVEEAEEVDEPRRSDADLEEAEEIKDAEEVEEMDEPRRRDADLEEAEEIKDAEEAEEMDEPRRSDAGLEEVKYAEEVKDAEDAEEMDEPQRSDAGLEEVKYAEEVDELQRSDADLEETEEVDELQRNNGGLEKASSDIKVEYEEEEEEEEEEGDEPQTDININEATNNGKEYVNTEEPEPQTNENAHGLTKEEIDAMFRHLELWSSSTPDLPGEIKDLAGALIKFHYSQL